MVARHRIAGSALAFAFAVAAPAHASITVETQPFITSPTVSMNFTSLNVNDVTANEVYSQDAIDVEYVGSINDVHLSSALGPKTPWFPNGGGIGYTKISLASDADIQNIQFLIGSGDFYPGDTAYYQLLENNSVVATGSLAVPYGYNIATTLGFSGSGFNTVEIQVANMNNSPDLGYFSPSNSDNGAIGNIAILTTSVVPLPPSFPLLGMALAGLIGCGRWASRQPAAAEIVRK